MNVNRENEEGDTPLYFAVRKGKFKKVTIEFGLKSFHFFFPGHANIVDLLANNGADVNQESNGFNLLFMAAIKGDRFT